MATNDTVQLNQVLWEELQLLGKHKSQSQPPEALHAQDGSNGSKPQDDASPSGAPPPPDELAERLRMAKLSGIGLSGGGIRSATFNLGLIQGLAKRGALQGFDYMSVVSGGGYIAGWLHAWQRQKRSKPRAATSPPQTDAAASQPQDDTNDPLQAVRGELARSLPLERKKGVPTEAIHSHQQDDSLAGRYFEAEPVRRLREYSNYLTPRVGVFSLDTWAASAIYVRNLIVNMVLCGALLIVFSILMRAAFITFQSLAKLELWALGVAGASAVAAGVFCASSLRHDLVKPEADRQSWPDEVLRRMQASWRRLRARWKPATDGAQGDGASTSANTAAETATPSAHKEASRPTVATHLGVAFATLTCWAMAGYALGDSQRWHWRQFDIPVLVVFVVGTSIPFLYSVCWRPDQLRDERPGPLDISWAGIATALAGFLSMVGFYWVIRFVPDKHAGHWTAPLLPFGLTLALGVSMAVQIGLSGKALSEAVREWQARFLGTVSLVAGLLAAGMLLSVHIPDWMLREGVPTQLQIATPVWAVVSAVGAWLGRLPSGKLLQSRLVRGFLLVVPYLFVMGGMVIAGYLCRMLLVAHVTSLLSIPFEPLQTALLSTPERSDAAGLLISGAIVTLIGLIYLGLVALGFHRVGINEFSLASLYRNRLIRCYLGAVNHGRRRETFAGLDPDDDFRLASLAQDGGAVTHPYLIYNATLNLVGGRNLAWQQRKARPFTFTPKYSGYALLSGDADVALYGDREGRYDAFRQTSHYAGGLSLGDVMSISGAAIAPHMGFRSSPALTLLMTTFNLRLGQWLPNPGSERWNQRAHKGAILLFIKELLGMSSDESNYVYLSDGGHFENLGLFQLVRRRCRFILLSDASCDRKYRVDDLGTAIQRVRTDLGVDIRIDTSSIKPDSITGHCERRCVTGEIDYGNGERGILLYVKAALCGREPSDVLTYAEKHSAFPHEGTTDQWFDEEQFECYRRLGVHTIDEVFGVLTSQEPAKNMESAFVELNQYWAAPARGSGRFRSHAEELNRITRSIREDENLSFLASQFYPEVPQLYQHKTIATGEHRSLPPDEKQLRAGFLACNELIQLMESVYLDLHLEETHDHPDNRGWMNLFSHWVWSSMFRTTWAISSCTFGGRFQLFCERHLGLKQGAMEVLPPAPVEEELQKIKKAIKDGETQQAQLEGAQEAGRPPEYSLSVPLNYLEQRILYLLEHENRELLKGSQVRALMVRVTNAAAPIVKPLQLAVGFAVTRVRTDGSGLEEVQYFRIQNHIRRMGLGRAGLAALMRHVRQNGGDLCLPDSPRTTARLTRLSDHEWLEAHSDSSETQRVLEAAGAEASEKPDWESLRHLFESVSSEVPYPSAHPSRLD